MTLLTERSHAGGFIISEANGMRSRKSIIIASGEVLAAGAVLGHITCGEISTSANGGNTGDGVLGPVTLSGGGAMPGDYVLTITVATTNAGDFQVIAPNGDLVGGGTVGTAFGLGGLAFTLADGAIDFQVGDEFIITVAELDLYVEYDPAGVDGREVAAGILFDAVNASTGDQIGVGFVRHAEVNGNEIAWKTGLTDLEIASGIEYLNTQGLIVR